ncbi:hypothetical protein [Sneathiella sp.]|uniref:hypothetical protein n=1 Tax=Sneathiella sp. TaxID=1964365 RepID=UPI00356770F1
MGYRVYRFSMAAGLAALILSASPLLHAEEAATVITLTQTPCQFIEAEDGIDRGFTSQQQSDCEKINAETGEKRVAESKARTLKPGKYIFRVTNKNVPYSLGFWVRDKDYNWANPLDKLTKTSVSGGGLDTGVTLDYVVELKEGEYLYSCPLNTTPDYNLHVTN